jgi:RNA polymerase sigma-70 factor, ECF subfamily
VTAADDRSLLLAWRSGDNRAGQRLVERHRPTVLRTFLNKASSIAEAEALAQRTFGTARADRVRLRDGAAVGTWLLAVARHVLLDWLDDTARRQRFAGRLPEASISDLGLGPSPAPAPSEDARRLLEALRRLPLESQLVVELATLEDLSPDELADVLECLEVAARHHLQTGLDALREALGDPPPRELDAWAGQLRRAWSSV